MTSNRSSRKNALEQLVQRKLLSEEGRQALIKLCDPFHDTDVNVCGIPDSLPEKSICREVPKTITISSPLADKTLPWDLHIYSLPERNFVPATDPYVVDQANATMNGSGEVDLPASGSVVRSSVGPIVAVAVAAGQPTTPADSSYPPTGSSTYEVLDFNDYYSGQNREIFSGIEVHNVTNKLNVGGTVTVYRLPQFTYKSNAFVWDANASVRKTDSSSIAISRCPPGNLQQAMLLQGSRQWEAEFGAYCVETFDLQKNDPQASACGIRAFVMGDNSSGSGYATDALPGIFRYSAKAGVDAPSGAQYKSVPKDTSGIYFTGLPGPSQLTITVRKGIETFPTFTDPLVTLARATPDYDPVFFELYKAIAMQLPPGVAVGENASGDFWDSVLGVIGDIAPIVGGAFGPAGAALGGLAGAAAKTGQAVRNKKDKKPEKEDDRVFKGGKAMVPPTKPGALTRR